VVESISKTPVGRDVAAAIVTDAFGDGAALADMTELTEGWFNAAYVLTLHDGRRCVLKVAPPPEVRVLTYEHDIMATEVAALRLLGERTSIPVPRVLWSDTTCRRVPSELFVMEHLSGTLLSELRSTLDPGQQQRVDGQLACFLREMHAITNPTFGLQAPTAPTFDHWRDAFVQMFDDVLADGAAAQVELPLGCAGLRSLVHDHADALDEVTVPCFVHWDLWDTNVFVDPHTLAVVGVIDFERALWGDPLMEGQFISRFDDAAFLLAYGAPVTAAPDARRRRWLYDMYLFMVMIVEASYRRYPTDDIEQLGRSRLATTLAAFGASR